MKQELVHKKTFVEIPAICHQLDLIGQDYLAVDGCKIPSNASKEHSGNFSKYKYFREINNFLRINIFKQQQTLYVVISLKTILTQKITLPIIYNHEKNYAWKKRN